MTWRENMSTDGPGGVNVPMVLLGLILFMLGIVVPGKEAIVVSTLLASGVGLAALGLAINQVKQIEVGPGGVKMSRDASDSVVPEPWLVAEGEMLNRIAVRVLADQELARQAVEDSLTTIRRRGSAIPKSQLDIATHRTLIAELHRKDKNRSWPSGAASVDLSVDGVPPALQALSFRVRVAYALSFEFQEAEMAAILDRTDAEIAADVRSAEAVVLSSRGDADG